MPTIKLKKRRGFAKIAGAGLIDRNKVQALKQGKSVELSVEEISWLKPGIYEEDQQAPKEELKPPVQVEEEEEEEEEEEDKQGESPTPRRRRRKRRT